MVDQFRKSAPRMGADAPAAGGCFQSCCDPRDDHAGQFLVGVKHFHAMASGGIADEFVTRVGREREEPLHDFRHAEIGSSSATAMNKGIFAEVRRNCRRLRRFLQRAGDQRLYFRMIRSNVNGLIDAATCAANSDGVLCRGL
jgi:hypothetical protein